MSTTKITGTVFSKNLTNKIFFSNFFSFFQCSKNLEKKYVSMMLRCFSKTKFWKHYTQYQCTSWIDMHFSTEIQKFLKSSTFLKIKVYLGCSLKPWLLLFSLLFDNLVTILSILVLLDLFSMLQYRYKNSQNLNLCTEQGNVALEPYQQG